MIGNPRLVELAYSKEGNTPQKSLRAGCKPPDGGEAVTDRRRTDKSNEKLEIVV